jgi:hypothetical protein
MEQHWDATSINSRRLPHSKSFLNPHGQNRHLSDFISLGVAIAIASAIATVSKFQSARR